MTKYVIAALLAVICCLSVANRLNTLEIRNLQGDLKLRTEERDLSRKSADELKLNLDSYIQSCEVTVKAVKEQAAKDKALYDAREGTLEKLSKKPPIKGGTEVKNAPQSTTGGTVYELDPEYVRLLNNAYCTANKNDPYCTP